MATAEFHSSLIKDIGYWNQGCLYREEDSTFMKDGNFRWTVDVIEATCIALFEE